MKMKWLSLITVLVLVLAMVPAALAEVGDTITVTGTVTEINEAEGWFKVVAEDTTEYTIYVPEDFDWSTIAVDMEVTFEAVEGEDGTYTLPAEMEEEEEPEYGKASSHFCADRTLKHPVGAGIAATYLGTEPDPVEEPAPEGEGEEPEEEVEDPDAAYNQVMDWFCNDHLGFGEIMLALQTADATCVDPESAECKTVDEILLMREKETGKVGWGVIWKDLGFKGKPGKGDAPEEGDDTGISENADQTAKPGKATAPGQLKKQSDVSSFVPPGQAKKLDKQVPPGKAKKNK